MEELKFDFVVAGSGLAGLYSAAYASNFGKVALLTKSRFQTSNTFWAQGGIAAVVDPDDTPEDHFDDTIKAGKGLCNAESVKVLVNEGRERVFDLIDMGMQFDYEEGKLALGLEGGHSKRRVLHAGGDATGREVVNFLIRKISALTNITVFENTMAYRLISDGVNCGGVYAHNSITGKHLILTSNSTILATGGASGIFSRTTNPHTSTGDGIALAYDAGACLADMEFIQFHPTAMYTETGETFLVSEAVRGEGAHLVNNRGERFMLREGLDELATRDVVSIMIHHEMKKTGSSHIFLKLDHLDPVKIKKRFSTISREAKKFGIDITRDPVPVAPAAHYMIGGVKTGLMGETNIGGLFVCGEAAATGVHGANRLASNSLLECIVFGKRAVDAALSFENRGYFLHSPGMKYNIEPEKELQALELRNRLADIMTRKAGIVRCRESLKKAVQKIEDIIDRANSFEDNFCGLRLLSLAEVCILIARSALIREESRGGHIREDFPKQSDDFIVNIIQKKGEDPHLLPVKTNL